MISKVFDRQYRVGRDFDSHPCCASLRVGDSVDTALLTCMVHKAAGARTSRRVDIIELEVLTKFPISTDLSEKRNLVVLVTYQTAAKARIQERVGKVKLKLSCFLTKQSTKPGKYFLQKLPLEYSLKEQKY